MIEGPWRAPSSPPETPVPDEEQARGFGRGGAAVGVGVQRVAAVDDDVARLEQRAELGSIMSSTGVPAFTISITRRGRRSDRHQLGEVVGCR